MPRRAFLLVVVSALLAIANPSSSPRAQAVQDPGLFVSGMRTPRIPPAGDWAEIVTVTSRWLVIQNEQGQQFPVSLDAIGEFVIRWPIDPANITGGAILETTGIDLGSRQISTDHVDVFEGAARALVQPTFQPLFGFNRTPSAFDLQGMNLTGIFIPTLPGEDQIPNRIHVAGPVSGVAPLRIAAGVGNSVSVFPGAGGLVFSQVSPGTYSYLRPGDLVYVVPADITPKTLVFSQMVAYKAMPLNQFVP